jgi:hypothetical protein
MSALLLRAGAVLEMIVSLVSATALSQSAAPLQLDFENTEAGALPDSFRAALTGKGGPVKWMVLEDPTAPAGRKVLAQTSADPTDYRFPVTVLRDVTAKDVEVSVRFKPVGGKVDQAAGLIARVRDENNYYVVRANALENNVRLYRVVKGNRQQFAGADTSVATGQWQLLALRIHADRFTVSLNGRTLFEASDRTFAEARQVGLWTKADSVTYFDELVVRRLD